LKPIEWTVRHAKDEQEHPSHASHRLGQVVVLSTGAGNLRFSATAGCGDETDLFLGLVAAFSASEGIRKDTGVISWVRWPNSVAIEGKTVATASAGVIRAKESNRVVIDFNINVSRPVSEGATSLLEVVGVEVDRKILLDKVLESLAWMHAGWVNGMHPQVLRRVKSMTETLGSIISVPRDGRRVAGVATDIDAKGRLVVRAEGASMTLSDVSEVLGL
jgi:BirA family transcriptional regulator, biotin operon repressor / biotin---[acetyl-CoA-carboxylase] ligase